MTTLDPRHQPISVEHPMYQIVVDLDNELNHLLMQDNNWKNIEARYEREKKVPVWQRTLEVRIIEITSWHLPRKVIARYSIAEHHDLPILDEDGLMVLTRDFYHAALIGAAMDDPTDDEARRYDEMMKDLILRAEVFGLGEML